jgi:hypothetical protein
MEELVIWISSTAMNAPSIPPNVPIHARVEPGVIVDVVLCEVAFIFFNRGWTQMDADGF